jgi:hypothetical protein
MEPEGSIPNSLKNQNIYNTDTTYTNYKSKLTASEKIIQEDS